MRWMPLTLLAVIASPVLLPAAVPGASVPRDCVESPLVRAQAPLDPREADAFDAEWFINANRTIWAGRDAGRWRVGRNKVFWIRPAGTDLVISGERLGASGSALRADVPCCYRSNYQATALNFDAPGCWQITAKAGNETLTFVTAITPHP